MANKKIGCILARVSRPSQNLKSQVDDLLRIADNKGFSVPDKFIFGEKISGMHTGFKKSLNNLLSALDIKNNHIEAVFIWEVTRLSRGAYDFVTELMQINTRNVPVYFYDMNLWTWDFEHNCLSRENCDKLIGASIYGRQEWDKISARTKRGREITAKQGFYIGHVADGYIPIKEGDHKKIEVDDNRKGVIERIFNLYIEGNSTDTIAQILNTEGVPTASKYRLSQPQFFNYKKTYKKSNGRDIDYNRDETMWQGGQIAQIITNRWYIGERSYGGEKYKIHPIISKEVFSKVGMLRNKRAETFRTNRKSKKHNYLLSGYIFCGKCGRKMYGHCTGPNNHYYCSSIEEGKKCGLRGINKENAEAIIIRTILFRALNEVVMGEKGVISDFFKISEDEKRKVKNDIKNKETELKGLEGKIKECDEIRKNYLKMIGPIYDDPKKKNRVEDLYELIDENDNERNEAEIKMAELKTDIIQLNKRLRISENIKNIADNISSLKDLATYRKLIENTIERIEVYNIDNSISYLKITYINGKEDGMIYSYPLLQDRFIYFNKDMLSKDHISFDGITSDLKIEKGYHIAFGNNGNGFMVLDDEGLKEELSKGPEWGDKRIKQYYSESISIRDFVLQARKGYPLLWKYDNSLFIEETDERRAEKSERYKEWRKKYNNGLPTCVPYVVKDGNYEEYLTQRKHLYNRKYKVKKNKRLSEEQKTEELERIDEALSLLKAKVKYLTRSEALERMKQQ